MLRCNDAPTGQCQRIKGLFLGLDFGPGRASSTNNETIIAFDCLPSRGCAEVAAIIRVYTCVQ